MKKTANKQTTTKTQKKYREKVCGKIRGYLMWYVFLDYLGMLYT